MQPLRHHGGSRNEARGGKGPRWKRLLLYIPLAVLLLKHFLYPLYYTEVVLSAATGHSASSIAATEGARPKTPSDPSNVHKSSLLSLTEITGETNACPVGFDLIDNVVDDSALQNALPQRIPRIVHQTAKSRCLTLDITETTEKWRFPGWSYYFHDDDAIQRLFEQEFAEFPYLEDVVRKCLVHGTLKADLWRYVVLWVHGGIYVDLDAIPVMFSPETIESATDALFVVEQYHLLSQYFMAVAPRHPLMYYAIHDSLTHLLLAPDTGRISAAMVTGPHALHRAFQQFRRDAGGHVDPASRGYKPVQAGHFVGSYNRSVTAIGVAENQNEFVNRDVLGGTKKKKAYTAMHMRHFLEDKVHATGQSCLSAMLPLHYNEQEEG